MTKFLQLLPNFLELILFAVTTGALGYTSGKGEWGLFVTFVVVAVLIFCLLKYLESAPLARAIDVLRRKEHRFASRFKDWGIQDIFNMADNQEMHERNIANMDILRKGETLSLLAETGSSYLNPAVRRHWDVLKAKLDEGYHLRLLLVDPFCPAKGIRNSRNEINAPLDGKFDIERLAQVLRSYQNVECRFTDQTYCSVLLTDKAAMYDPYHLGKTGDRIENYFLAIQIVRSSRASLYDVLKSHFEYLWETGLQFEAWISMHESKIPPPVISLFKGIDREP